MPLPHLAPSNDSGMARIIPIGHQNNTTRLRVAYKKAKRRIAELKAQNRMLQQLSESLGDCNRYFASQKLGRPATDDEAFDHYVIHGGKQHFDQTHPPRG